MSDSATENGARAGNTAETARGSPMLKRVRLAVLLAILVAAGLWASGVSIPGSSLPRVGQKYTADLEYNGARDRSRDIEAVECPVEITVLAVEKMAYGGGQLIRADVRVKNLGKQSIQFSHTFAQLRDGQGRRFKGKRENDINQRIRSSRWFIDLEPGFEDTNRVFFTIPEDALDGDLHLGFTSIVDEDDHQARALIFENGSAATGTAK